jgi:hypothetical protein
MFTPQQKSEIRLSIWFDMLTRNQRIKIRDMGYSYLFLENIKIEDLKKVTKSKKIHDRLVNLRRSSFFAVA